MQTIRRAFRWLALWFCPVAVAVLAASCTSAPAPPPETTAITQVQLEEAAKDVARIKANKDRTDAYWAKLLGAENGKRLKARLEADTVAAVEAAAAESRPFGPADVQALVDAHLARVEASAKEIAATVEAAKDRNLDVVAERIALALDYVTEITERERAVARYRKMIGLDAATKENPP